MNRTIPTVAPNRRQIRTLSELAVELKTTVPVLTGMLQLADAPKPIPQLINGITGKREYYDRSIFTKWYNS